LDAETLAAIADALGRHDWIRSLPRGTIVATAVLAASHPADSVKSDLFGDYRPGRWAWWLADVRPVQTPIPARGRQMIGWQWVVPEGVGEGLVSKP
jgi:hypothetical protein